MTQTQSTLVAIADLHGHLDLFDLLLERIDLELPGARVVTLGDYVDNGPQIPGLLDRLVALKEERPGHFFPILGNHDLALLRALGWPQTRPDPLWYGQWQGRYWNPGLGTPEAYGAHDLDSFVGAFPAHHRGFLQSLPWYQDDGEYLCVHAGLHPGPIAPQRAALDAKALPAEPGHLPDPIRNKALATAHDPDWERVVVSGHTWLHDRALFSMPRRVCVSATSDHGGGLIAVALPQRHCWQAMQGKVSAIGAGLPRK